MHAYAYDRDHTVMRPMIIDEPACAEFDGIERVPYVDFEIFVMSSIESWENTDACLGARSHIISIIPNLVNRGLKCRKNIQIGWVHLFVKHVNIYILWSMNNDV